MTDWTIRGFWYTSHLQGFLLLCSFSPPGVDSIHLLRIWVLSSGQNSLTNPGISIVWTEVSTPLFLAKHSTALAASWLPYCVALRHKLFYEQYNQMLVPFEGMLSGPCFFFFKLLTQESSFQRSCLRDSAVGHQAESWELQGPISSAQPLLLRLQCLTFSPTCEWRQILWEAIGIYLSALWSGFFLWVNGWS